ncbi:MAG: TonB family protein [Candidatus Sulfotelmatobacter sp.]
MVKPIWPVLAQLGIEGEYCGNAVDAVEKVTTQLFQIVITDWEDQPEATFLLKTARDQKAVQRPLTLAIVKDEAKLPEALRAGANSVLLKPIRPEQVRDTMSTACELIRTKQAPPTPPPQLPAQKLRAPETPARTAGPAAAAAAAPAPLSQAPEKAFRAGEFLQSASPAPSAQFDTESDLQKSMEQAAVAQVDALTELEPMAASVAEEPVPEPVEPNQALTGWASLQARLTKSVPQTLVEASTKVEAPTKNELLSYGDTPSYGAQPSPQTQNNQPAPDHSSGEAQSEAALFSYMAGESKEEAEPAQESRPKHNKIILVGALGVAFVVLAAVPKTRQSLQFAYRSSVRAGKNWLNPQPVAVPPTVVQHETFGQEGDEYKLPVAANIPDATTDPSQIRVLPVIDPTAKPTKGSDAAGAQGTASDDGATDQNQSATGGSVQPQTAGSPVQDQATISGNPASSTAATSPAPVSSMVPSQPNLTAPPSAVSQQKPLPQPVQIPTPLHTASAGSSSAIPSSLRTQTASMTPDASGAKPLEAAMSSIEPVNLPESAVWDLLAQKIDPVYPDAAKAGGQHGSVVLQVLIGRDGTVQDAKFMQGSLVFARSAIDAVKQWHFKAYSLNGRAVSVQSLITLNFKPPA